MSSIESGSLAFHAIAALQVMTDISDEERRGCRAHSTI
jgi:ribosome-associated protein YbcJ (S4-like RNA binding protein)